MKFKKLLLVSLVVTSGTVMLQSAFAQSNTKSIITPLDKEVGATNKVPELKEILGEACYSKFHKEFYEKLNKKSNKQQLKLQAYEAALNELKRLASLMVDMPQSEKENTDKASHNSVEESLDALAGSHLLDIVKELKKVLADESWETFSEQTLPNLSQKSLQNLKLALMVISNGNKKLLHAVEKLKRAGSQGLSDEGSIDKDGKLTEDVKFIVFKTFMNEELLKRVKSLLK